MTTTTDKFNKDIQKFFVWTKANDCVIDNGVWNTTLLEGFEEPGRNKMEAFLKHVMKSNVVKINREIIDDAKILAKMFRETKKGIEKPKKITEKEKKISEPAFTFDADLDTSKVTFAMELSCSTNDLRNKFGEPLRTGKEGDKHRWEWKLKSGDTIFSIYDWIDEKTQTFEDIDNVRWCLGCYNKKQDELVNYINTTKLYKNNIIGSNKEESEDEVCYEDLELDKRVIDHEEENVIDNVEENVIDHGEEDVIDHEEETAIENGDEFDDLESLVEELDLGEIE